MSDERTGDTQTLFDDGVYETQFIAPCKEMPLSVFRELWRIALFTELMPRDEQNRVIWDARVTTFYSPSQADAEYYALQKDWLEMTFEVPEGAVGLSCVLAAKQDDDVARLLAEMESEPQ